MGIVLAICKLQTDLYCPSDWCPKSNAFTATATEQAHSVRIPNQRLTSQGKSHQASLAPLPLAGRKKLKRRAARGESSADSGSEHPPELNPDHGNQLVSYHPGGSDPMSLLQFHDYGSADSLAAFGGTTAAGADRGGPSLAPHFRLCFHYLKFMHHAKRISISDMHVCSTFLGSAHSLALT